MDGAKCDQAIEAANAFIATLGPADRFEIVVFEPHGRLAAILKRRAPLGPNAFVFGSAEGEFQDSFKTAWESVQLVAHGYDRKRTKPGARVDRDM